MEAREWNNGDGQRSTKGIWSKFGVRAGTKSYSRAILLLVKILVADVWTGYSRIVRGLAAGLLGDFQMTDKGGAGGILSSCGAGRRRMVTRGSGSWGGTCRPQKFAQLKTSNCFSIMTDVYLMVLGECVDEPAFHQSSGGTFYQLLHFSHPLY